MIDGKPWRGLLLFGVGLWLQAALVVAEQGTAQGKWVKRGLPLAGDEFPACYQLWVCVPQDTPAGEVSKHVKQMPLGTWGTCENSLQGAEASCGECLAPEPEPACVEALP